MLDPKHDWYQNLTHVFVSFKIKKGGEALKSALKVTFTPNAVQLVNEANGEVLVHLDVANEITPD